MADGFLLSPKDYDKLREMLRDFDTRRRNTVSASSYKEDDNPSPSVHIAFSPIGGIAPRVGPFPGSAVCQIYRISRVGGIDTLVQVGKTARVLNIHADGIPGQVWFGIKRDSFGAWLAELPSDADEGVGTGTGTGSGGGSVLDPYVEDPWDEDQTPYVPPDDVSVVLVSSEEPNILLNGIELDPGQTITIVNIGENTILVPDESPLVDPDDQISIPTGGTLALLPNATITIWNNPETGSNTLLVTTETTTPPIQTLTINTDTSNLQINPGTTELHLTVTSPSDLTGLQGGYDGQMITLFITEDSTSELTILDQSGSSDPENQFGIDGAPWPLGPTQQLGLTYDGDSGLWVVSDPYAGRTYRPTLTAAGSPYDDYELPEFTSFFVPELTTGNVTITGLDWTGSSLLIVNDPASVGTLTLENNSGSSSQMTFDLSIGQDLQIEPGEQTSLFVIEGGSLGDTSASIATTNRYASGGGGWISIPLDYTDFSAASSSNTITLYSLPAGGILEAAFFHVTQSFQGGGLIAYSLDMGKTGDPGFFFTNGINLFGTASDEAQWGAITPYFNAVGTNITLTAQAGGGNLNAATQGTMNVLLKVGQAP